MDSFWVISFWVNSLYLALELLRKQLCYFAAAGEECAPDAGLVQDLPYNLAVAMDEVHIV